MKKYIECACKTEGILVEYNTSDELYYISFLGSSPNNFKLNLWQRFKCALRLLIKGKIYNDQVILNHDEAVELLCFMSDNGPNKEKIKTYTMDEMYVDAQRGIF